jgi:redox-sensitive bicupin YhaK (pirin superfamily)
MATTRRTFLTQAAAAALGLTVPACATRKETAVLTTPQTSARLVREVLPGMATSDGAGVRLTRVIGQPRLRNLDPFLMLDRFHSDDPGAYIAGFPDHPHRGFETVTVMLDGRMRHKDSRGNEGLIRGGGIQWMTAGRGIVHSEMPEQERGLMSGFQLWVNLPASEKMTEPFYQDLQPERLAVAKLDGRGEARVVSGDLFGVKGPVRPRPAEPLLAHLSLGAGQKLEFPVPVGHTAFVFVNEGALTIGERAVRRAELAVLEAGERVAFVAGAEGAQLLFAAGKPFGEPIVQHGPFVMNTREEIERAFYDYRRGTLGHD